MTQRRRGQRHGTVRRFPGWLRRAAACSAAAFAVLAGGDLTAQPALGQQQPGTRPRIGLALAGGGAKGCAHIGVLKVLEELRVPVDFIAGTSMGAVVGGLYASGMSADEIASTVLTVDWEHLLRDKPPRRDLAFRRKDDELRYVLDFEAGLKGGKLVLPTGLLSGQKLGFMLQALTLPVAGVSDFDELPIPFRAVATDVSSGEMVVLDQGELATAIRASMAIPSVFSVVELDGRILVDGGVSNNVPVDVVREMGADIVIAVDIGAPLTDRQVGSLLQNYQQLIRMLTRLNMEPRLAQADHVITPPVAQYGTLEFSSAEEILQAGVEAARSAAEWLEPLAIPAEEYERMVAARLGDRPPVPTVEFVRWQGNRRVDDRVIANRLEVAIGEPLDLERLSRTLNEIYGLGDFVRVGFAVVEEDGRSGLLIEFVEKPWGPDYLHLGLDYQTDFATANRFGLLLNLTATRLTRKGGEWRNDVFIGTDRRVESEFFQPLSFERGWFLAPSLAFRNEHPTFYDGGRATGELDTRVFAAGLDLGYEWSKYGQTRLGIRRGTASVKLDSGFLPPEGAALLTETIDFGGFRFEGVADRLDDAAVPHNGYLSRLRVFHSVGSLGAEADYTRLDLRASYFGTLRRRHTVLLAAEGGWTPDGELPGYDQFSLGGLGSLSGFAEAELRGSYIAVVRLGYYYHLFGTVYAGGWAEAGNAWSDEDDVDLDDLIGALTAIVAIDSAFGPIYLGYGQAEEGNGKLYLRVGRAF